MSEISTTRAVFGLAMQLTFDNGSAPAVRAELRPLVGPQTPDFAEVQAAFAAGVVLGEESLAGLRG